MPFPVAAGPTSLTLVKAHLRITDNVDDVAITDAVVAVNAKVQQFRVAQVANLDEPAPTWDAWPHIVHGATLLAARLWRRRNTPDGVAAFADAAPVYVRRHDPDVALLLQLGEHAKPAVG